MALLERLAKVWEGVDHPFLIDGVDSIHFRQVMTEIGPDLTEVRPGDVVALIGDFEPRSISTLLRLIDLGAIVVPLTDQTRGEHEYFFESALVDFVVCDGAVKRRSHHAKHDLIEMLRSRGHAGLVLFSTGTTGRPKAILHDLSFFLRRFETPRPALRTLGFLLFDHIGGINTFLHTLYNRGVVVSPGDRSVGSVLSACRTHGVEVLPTTPTFLRMMLMSGMIPDGVPSCLGIITYGTERMDQTTLDELCRLLPSIDFRQTFGMSELGIVRVKSEARNSLFMRVGGEGVETRVVDGVLQIRSDSRMLGYLNAPSPFDSEGWYNTGDLVLEKNGFYQVVGRVNEVINVGGLKFVPSEVERVALEFPGVALVKVTGRANPITGQHAEMTVQPSEGTELDKDGLLEHLKARLQSHMVPRRIRVESVSVGHRFKKL